MAKHATLLGAGLVGSLLAVYLRRRGYAVDVYERRPDLRKAGAYGGRSINLALSDRGFRALEAVGLADEVRQVGIPMYGRMMHDEKGQLSYQAYGKEGQAIYSVSRGGLNFKMMDLAEAEGARLHFLMRSTEVDLTEKIVHFEKDDTRQRMSVPYELLFGSDGAFSALRGSLQKRDRFDYSQDYLSAGYKELTIPGGPNGEFLMEKNALHIWPRGSYMMIALPNPDGSFTCTLFFPFEGPDSFASLQTREQVAAFFDRVFPDAVPLMPTLLDDYFNNPTSSLVTVKCSPWTADSAALIGDAAHAIVPFYGQGMNCGFEDVYVLNQLIDAYQEDWSQILPAYQASRKPDGDAIADLAKANFIEMRDKVADPDFLLRKKIEARIHQLYPQKWVPLYTMVTFSPDIRYSEALRLGQVQDTLMDKVMAREGIREHWENDENMAFIHDLMAQYDRQ